MIEIVFGTSAGNSLRLAQHFGEGAYRGDEASVIMRDQAAPSAAVVLASRQADKEHRRQWETARPLGGDPDDVHVLPLSLSVGEISEEIPGDQRLSALRRMMGADPDAARQVLAASLRTLRSILDRSQAGEAARIWYSTEPDEMSGLYWMLAQLAVLDGQMGPVSVVRLPLFEQCTEKKTGSGTRLDHVIQRSGWGDVAPDEWGRLQKYEVAVSPLLVRVIAGRWNQLQSENAPLRAVLNGSLVSLPEDAYDPFIRAEIAHMDPEFDEALLVGNVLSQGRGPGDMLIAERIQAMIDAGELTAVTEAPPDSPYRRRLRRGNHI